MASAALGGREHVAPEDVMSAVRMVILPRSDLSELIQQEVRSPSVLPGLRCPAMLGGILHRGHRTFTHADHSGTLRLTSKMVREV